MNLGTRGALTFHLGDYCFAVRVEEAGRRDRKCGREGRQPHTHTTTAFNRRA